MTFETRIGFEGKEDTAFVMVKAKDIKTAVLALKQAIKDIKVTEREREEMRIICEREA